MFRKILCILALFIMLPCFAGELDKALKNNDKVFLYLYTPTCGYCNKFNPVYQKVSRIYGNKCKFLKIDASTNEGIKLMRSYGARYVPYVLMIDSKNRKAAQIAPGCLLDFSCTEREVNKFTN